MTYTIYRLNLNNVPIDKQTFEKKYEIWDKAVAENVFVVCKTEMAKMITRRTLIGYRYAKINAHAFDDLIMQLRDKPDKLINKLKTCSEQGRKHRNEYAVVGNPPYQGVNHSQIYPFFYLSSIALGEHVSLIFPTGWQEPKNANNLARMNTAEVKYDKQIVFIDNRQNVFPGIGGAEWTNIILWKKGYDNKLDGSQLIYTNGENPEEIKLPLEISSITKPAEIIKLGNIVTKTHNFKTAMNIVSTNKPWFKKEYYDNYDYYKLPVMFEERQSDDDLTLYASNERIRYCPKTTHFLKIISSL